MRSFVILVLGLGLFLVGAALANNNNMTLLGVGRQSSAVPTIIFLTAGTTWHVPSDWTSTANTIEAIGGGGGGSGADATNSSGTGGGGGEYRLISNQTLTPGSTVAIQIGQGGAGGTGAANGTGGTASFLKDNSSTIVIQANGGGGGILNTGGGAGGSGGTGTGTSSVGGAGGFENCCRGGGGGGGAGGPLGAGAAGGGGSVAFADGGAGGGGSSGGFAGVDSSNDSGVAGGDNDGHTDAGGVGATAGSSPPPGSTPTVTIGHGGPGGGGGAGAFSPGEISSAGGNGGAGKEWDALHGAGGGGGGGGGDRANTPKLAQTGGAGGLYGGGGGGEGYDGNANITSGAGANGIIVITYPVTPPSSIACDIGPNYTGSIPTGAVDAGFTHCAINYDFTNTSNFTYNGNTYNFSTIGTWLACTINAATTPSGNPPLWWPSYYSGGAVVCSNYNIIADGGTNVLDETWHPSDASAGTEMTWMLNDPNNGGGDCTPTCPFTFPNGHYIEIKKRATTASLTAFPDSTQHIAISTFSAVVDHPTAYMEWDLDEQFLWGQGAPAAPTGGGACVYWGSPDFPCNSAAVYWQQTGQSWDPSQYFTYGMLDTSDGSTQMGKCAYLNNIRVFCATPFSATNAYNARHFLGTGIGDQNHAPPTVPSVNMTEYTQRITIWEPPGCTWQSAQCNGTVIH